ncbi:N-acetylneuraminate synthase family protein [Salinarimonas sp.]|uniref:N-acetylneuraminate synthase family protein n=1 Tax=Salinarimonas sp. TaxID=2766526 RepID=UPI0032D94EE4
MPSTFTIADRPVGPGHRPFVIAEVAQAHDGSLGAAHAFIDCAAECGADAIKFQTHIAEAESTRDEPFRVRFSYEDATRYDYWTRMEFSAEQWAGLARHAREAGLVFLSSPFSLEAIALLEALDVPAWKVASGEVGHGALVDAMLATGKPLLLSSGMSTYADLDGTIARIARAGERSALAVFQCTTKYPTPLEEVGLDMLDAFSRRFGVPVGLSDHSADTLPSIAAMARGASLIEVHLAFHRSMFGPDTKASLVPEQLREVCRARDAIHTMLTHPLDKDGLAKSLAGSAALFTRSLALRAPQPMGTVIEADMLTLKKPGTGIPETERDAYIGRRLARAVPHDRLLRPDDFAPGGA